MSLLESIFQRAVELYDGPDLDEDDHSANTSGGVWISAVYEVLENKTNAEAYAALGELLEDDWFVSVTDWSATGGGKNLAALLCNLLTDGAEPFEEHLKLMLPANHAEIDARRTRMENAYAAAFV